MRSILTSEILDIMGTAENGDAIDNGEIMKIVNAVTELDNRCRSLERTGITRTSWCHQMAESLREAGLEEKIPELLR